MSPPDHRDEAHGPTINIDPRQALSYISRRQITILFKEFLSILERSNDKHTESLNRLYDKLPDQYKTYVDLADWWTEEETVRMRKEVLQRGNDAIRVFNEELEKYEIDFRR